MIQISGTVTVGNGSEIHNHDRQYRSTLKHVINPENDVIELIPYKDYKTQINEIMRPYIEEYNERQEKKYKAAWEKFNEGKIKNKPKKKDYKLMGFDYYNDHKNDIMKIPRNGKTEVIPIFRSFIIGIGDQDDKKKIPQEVAVRIFQNTLEQFKNDFPNFHILGATCHAVERGYWHFHLDVKPLYEKENSKGLKVGVGLDKTLIKMGYHSEQSIINARDKVPLLFNAMRNQIYRELESSLNAEGIRMQYGVSERKDPGKDSGKNQRLEDWQKTRDAVRELQHKKNTALDILERDKISPDDLKTALTAAIDITDKIEEIENSPRKRIDKNKVVVEFHLLDQLRSFVEKLVELIAVFLRDRDEYKAKYEELKKEKEKLKETHECQKSNIGEKSVTR